MDFEKSDDEEEEVEATVVGLRSGGSQQPLNAKSGSIAARLALRLAGSRSRSSTLPGRPPRPQLLCESSESGLRAALLNERLARLHISERAGASAASSPTASPRPLTPITTPRSLLESPNRAVSPPVPSPSLESLLCPRCTCLARDSHHLSSLSGDLVAPSANPPTCCRDGASLAQTQQAPESLSPKQSPPTAKEALAKMLAARQRAAVLNEVLDDRQCLFAWHSVYSAVTGGRGGVGDAMTRERLWLLQARPIESDTVSATPEFDALIRTARLPRVTLEQILKDLHRTLDSSQTAGVIERAYYIESLYRGLVAHAALRPDIGYVQGMNFLWAVLTIAIVKPNSQLAIAEHVVRNVLPYYFTTHQSVGALVDGLVLQYYFRAQRPRDYEALAVRFAELEHDSDQDMEETMHSFFVSFCLRNFSTLFARSLPLSLTLCLWDRVMLRGPCELFEFSVRSLHYYVRRTPLDKIEAYQQVVQMHSTLFADVKSADAAEELYADMARRTRLPLGHILSEDLALRRRCAAGIIFERICPN
jgi:Rab-GTPase-TBC domain